MPMIKTYPLLNSDELGESDLDEVKHFEWIVYKYETRAYEGSGDAILYDEGKYYHHNLGHCSCYGPMDHFEGKSSRSYDSLEEIKSSFSKELLEEVMPLLDFIKRSDMKLEELLKKDNKEYEKVADDYRKSLEKKKGK